MEAEAIAEVEERSKDWKNNFQKAAHVGKAVPSCKKSSSSVRCLQSCFACSGSTMKLTGVSYGVRLPGSSLRCTAGCVRGEAATKHRPPISTPKFWSTSCTPIDEATAQEVSRTHRMLLTRRTRPCPQSLPMQAAAPAPLEPRRPSPLFSATAATTS